MYFRCLNTFNSKKSLASHQDYCKSYEAITIELPKKGSKISFKIHNTSMWVPFIIYADFESFTPQLSTCQPNPGKSYNKQYQKHIPSGFCYRIKCFDDTLYSQRRFGEDSVRDHCHLSGKFRSAAHEVCNIKYKVPKFFPVVFHNLSGNDSQLFIKTLGNSEGNISCITNNEENYIFFTKQVIVDKFLNKEGKEVNV